mgnify:CR=1 FL=1
MTEKKDLGHGPVEEEPLSERQQQELHEQEQYFRQAFCSVSCPPLPESLSADAMWEKICSGAGDHQVTVDPASMQEELRQETEAAPQKGKVIPFPQRTGKKARARRRRTLAVACTLVLVVGLSVAYWQLQGPLGQMQDLVSGNSQASTAESAESAAAEATAADADTQTEESAEAVEEAAVPMMAAPPEEETASDETASGGAGQTEQRSAETQDAAIAPQSAQPQQEQATVQPKTQQEQNETDSQREELRQRILASIDAGQQEQSTEGNPDTGGSGQQQANQLTAQSAEATAEEPVEESVEAVVPEQEAETAGDTQEGGSVSILKNMMENSKESQPQSFQLKNGSVNYDPASGEVTVMDLNQQQTATLSLPAGAQVFASDVTLAAIVPDEQAQTVTLTLYSVEDLQNPQAVSTVTHQGELFDAYQSVSDSYTLVTSVWFDREQVESGEFLPQVNGAELSPDQINIIEGYEQGNQVNYLITTTITPDSVKTRADLYLN